MCTIITKSVRTFIGNISTEYYKLTIIDDRVEEEELTSTEARAYINEHELPEIYRLDHNHIIWGDVEFKDKCPEYFKLQQHGSN